MRTLLKLGGELLESADAMSSAAGAVARLAARGPLVVVHGGGRAIDAELRARGREPRFVDGLRITDVAALDAVVMVLAGRNNTALVAAVGAQGVRAVGLTGADGRIGLSTRAGSFETVSGSRVDLGLVGRPEGADASLLLDLMGIGCVPVIASVGVTREGCLLNVNADTLAAHLAVSIGAERLILAGATAGVLDAEGATIPVLTSEGIGEMTRSGAAHSGMIAKLAACTYALDGGVADVRIVSGRGIDEYENAPGTRIVDAPAGSDQDRSEQQCLT